MNREFKRDLNNNYMILNDEEWKAADDYRARMLISNQIPFILKCNVRKFDGITKYYYEITSKHPMNRIYDKKKIGMTELSNLITSFLKVLDHSMEYLLSSNDLVLNPEYIYMNIETNQVYFCYMPGYEADISKSFNELTSYLLDKIDHNDKNAVATAYELYRQTLNENYCLREILNSISEDVTIAQYGDTEELNSEEEIRNNNFEINEQNEEMIKTENKKKINPVYLFGGMTIILALAFLIYYIASNIDIITNIKLENNMLLQIGGILLIAVSLTAYVLYKKYQVKQKADNDEDNLILLPENEEQSAYKKIDQEDSHQADKGYLDNRIFEKQRSYKDEIIKSREQMDDKQQIFQNEKAVNSNDWINYNHSTLETDAVTRDKQDYQTETYGNTVLLTWRTANRRLIATKNDYNNFELTNKSFLIGKMEEHVDGIIHNELISRIHAEIKRSDDKYYLTDLNSTNGTYHNDRRLEANETVEIMPEDVIRFATAEYLFR